MLVVIIPLLLSLFCSCYSSPNHPTIDQPNSWKAQDQSKHTLNTQGNKTFLIISFSWFCIVHFGIRYSTAQRKMDCFLAPAVQWILIKNLISLHPFCRFLLPCAHTLRYYSIIIITTIINITVDIISSSTTTTIRKRNNNVRMTSDAVVHIIIIIVVV